MKREEKGERLYGGVIKFFSFIKNRDQKKNKKGDVRSSFLL